MERPSGRGALWAARPELRAWHTQVSRARGSSAVDGNSEIREARGAARRGEAPAAAGVTGTCGGDGNFRGGPSGRERRER